MAEVNNPPVFQPLGLQSVQEGAPFQLTLVAVDPDAPPKSIRYRLETAPRRATLDPVTGVFSWLPVEEEGPGSYQIIVHADEDGGAPSTTLTFSIVVNEKNETPVIQAIPDFDVSEGDTVAFKVVAADIDYPAQKLTYTLVTGAPAEAVALIPTPERLSGPSILMRVPEPTSSRSAWSMTELGQSRPRRVSPSSCVPCLGWCCMRSCMHRRSEGTAFVELRNMSTTTAWALDGWQLTGLGYHFPVRHASWPHQLPGGRAGSGSFPGPLRNQRHRRRTRRAILGCH